MLCLHCFRQSHLQHFESPCLVSLLRTHNYTTEPGYQVILALLWIKIYLVPSKFVGLTYFAITPYMNGVLGLDSALLRLYWDAKPGLMRWICYDACPWCRIDRSTRWPTVHCATTVPRMPPHIYANPPSVLSHVKGVDQIQPREN